MRKNKFYAFNERDGSFTMGERVHNIIFPIGPIGRLAPKNTETSHNGHRPPVYTSNPKKTLNVYPAM